MEEEVDEVEGEEEEDQSMMCIPVYSNPLTTIPHVRWFQGSEVVKCP